MTARPPDHPLRPSNRPASPSFAFLELELNSHSATGLKHRLAAVANDASSHTLAVAPKKQP